MDLRYLMLISTILINGALQASTHAWTHFGIRPLGMGNAYVAVADDYNALFYNPAGLAKQELDGELLSLQFETATRTLSFVQEILDSLDALSDSTKLLELFKKQTGKTHHVSLSWTPHIVFKNFGMGVGLHLPVSLVVHNNINIRTDLGPRIVAPISFAKSFLNEKLSFGLSFKVRARGGISKNFTIQTIEDITSQDALEKFVEGGIGYGADLGFLFTPTKKMEPTLGISVTDLGASSYTEFDFGTMSTSTPKIQLPSVNTGVSLKPIQKGRMYLLTAVDAHMINQPVHYSHKLNFGMELGYGSLVKLQTGLKSGYLTAGLQLDAGLLNLRFATYTVEHAPVAGLHSDLAERRYALQFKLLL